MYIKYVLPTHPKQKWDEQKLSHPYIHLVSFPFAAESSVTVLLNVSVSDVVCEIWD